MRLAAISLALVTLAPPLFADDSAKAKAYQVPYRLTDTNHVLVRVKINGKGPFNFILDTGAPALFVSTAVSRKLGVKADEQGWGVFERFEIEGGATILKARGRVEDPFQLEGMNALGLAGADLHGIIGYTVLARYRMEFDFTKHKMAWQPLDFQPPQPQGLGKQGVSSGLDAIGSVMKIAGAMLGKKPQQHVTLRGFLGIGLEDSAGQVVVRRVLTDGPAFVAGLHAGDRITHFQGQEVGSVKQLLQLAARLGPNETTRLTIARGDAVEVIQFKAGSGL
jgi:hypothetical protein